MRPPILAPPVDLDTLTRCAAAQDPDTIALLLAAAAEFDPDPILEASPDGPASVVRLASFAALHLLAFVNATIGKRLDRKDKQVVARCILRKPKGRDVLRLRDIIRWTLSGVPHTRVPYAPRLVRDPRIVNKYRAAFDRKTQ